MLLAEEEAGSDTKFEGDVSDVAEGCGLRTHLGRPGEIFAGGHGFVGRIPSFALSNQPNILPPSN